MLLHKRPSDECIHRFLASAEGDHFSYPEVGATRGTLPGSCAVDHHRVQLGAGLETFARAVEAVRRWAMFHLGWVQLYWPEAPIQVGSTVAILSRQWAFWSLNASRIVYLIEEDAPCGATASPTGH